MKKLIGDKKFYQMVLAIAVPIMIQHGITNFVNMLDNIMIGQVGTEQMSGVSIVNQLMFVFMICIFGSVSGPGIFGAQFFGKGDHDGVRNTFRLKIMICTIICLAGILIFSLFGSELINLYLHNESSVGDIKLTLHYGSEYLKVMMIGLVPFVIAQTYSSTLRETGETMLPMKAGITAVLINLVLNYVLIYGKFGAPQLGVVGAAVATVISRITECLIIVVWTHRHREKNIFIQHAYRSFRIPKYLVIKVAITGTPLLINEALWASGMATLMQRYSVRGLEVVAAINISNTIGNVFNIVFIAIGSAIAIIVGQLLGANKMKEAKDTAVKLIFFSVVCCIAVGCIMALTSPLFPRIYKTDQVVKDLAQKFIIITSVMLPLNAFTHATYFTLRSGGKTIITFLFDSVYIWTICIPIAFFLTKGTVLAIIPIYIICQSLELIKCTIGFLLIKKGVWLHNMVSEQH